MPNAYVTPSLSFQFHYFALRKMHFLLRARAVAVFPGGFGTFDEAFELLTLIQTGKVKPLPILFFGREFWERVVNFEALVEEGVIAPDDLELFTFCRDAPRKPGSIVCAIMPSDGEQAGLRADMLSLFGPKLPIDARRARIPARDLQMARRASSAPSSETPLVLPTAEYFPSLGASGAGRVTTLFDDGRRPRPAWRTGRASFAPARATVRSMSATACFSAMRGRHRPAARSSR